MNSINVLGRKFTLKIETNKKKKKDRTVKQSVELRLLVILLLFTVFGISSKFSLKNTGYKIGDMAKEIVIAPVSLTYVDNIKKDEIISYIARNTPKQYKRDNLVLESILKDIDYYFNRLDGLNKELSENQLIEFINDTDIIIEIAHLKKMISMSFLERAGLKIGLKFNTEDLLSKGVKDDLNYVQGIINKQKGKISNIELDLIAGFIQPNEFQDNALTEKKIKDIVSKVKDIVVDIEAGETIIKKGQILNASDIDMMKRVGVYNPYYNLKNFFGGLLYFLVVSFLFFFIGRHYIKKEINTNKYYYTTLIALGFMILVSRLIAINLMFLYPFGALVLLLGIIVSEKYSLIMSSLAMMFIFAYYGFNYVFLVISLVEIIIGIYYSKKIKNRTDIVNSGIVMAIVKVFCIFALNLIVKKEFVENIFSIIQVLSSGILSGMITMALLPYFENTFNILTDIKLVELGDFSNPLLRDLLIKAPGTFHHSILVATLAESAAEAVGANATFARVASYYHDVGKMKRPNFFVENQNKGLNPHESLSPYLSSLIITSHTRDGEEMARRHKIPKEIRDVMKEHQGTTLLAYFYNKARKENEDVNEANFKYDGPKPKTKESAIIMLADSIEAAVRSIENKNPITIENMIRKIITGKIEYAQLSEAELTFKDIEIIINTFVKVIQGIYHSRIKYPDLDKLEARRKK